MACLECRRRRIRCNNIKPICQHCDRLSKKCEYASHEERRGPKKRSVKQLEDRLAILEAQLKVRTTSTSDQSGDTPFSVSQLSQNADSSQFQSLGSELSAAPGTDLDFTDFQQNFRFSMNSGQWPDISGAEIDISSLVNQVDDRFPDVAEIQELTDVYFEDVHPNVPILHRSKHDPNLLYTSEQQPPLCLRYIMWAQAAARSSKYLSRASGFYRSARMHLDHDEMQGTGDSFATLAHVQTWALVAAYEAENAIGIRAFMSTRRAIGLSNMLDLHRIDDGSLLTKRSLQILPLPGNPIEAEERRRTFWYLFYGDRWVSSGPGRSIQIREEEISTLLPCSDSEFESGVSSTGQTLENAILTGLDDTASPLKAAVLVSRILEQCARHLRAVPSASDTAAVQDYWLRHQQLDNNISKFLLNMPDHLRADKTKDSLAIWVAMCLHLYIINISQAAISLIKESGDAADTPRFLNRARRSAQEIAETVRTIASLGIRKFYAHTPFAVYAACTVFATDLENGHDTQQAAENISFMLDIARMCRKHWRGSQIAVCQIAEIITALQDKGVQTGIKVAPEDLVRVGVWANSNDDIDSLGPLFERRSSNTSAKRQK